MSTKLSDDKYKRPKRTKTESLKKEDIDKLLEGYDKVTDISCVPIGTHIRYFIKEAKGKHKFRMGGFVKYLGLPDYLILENSEKKSWSVQIKDTTFYAKKSQYRLMKEYEEKIAKLEKELSNERKKSSKTNE